MQKKMLVVVTKTVKFKTKGLDEKFGRVLIVQNLSTNSKLPHKSKSANRF